MLNMQVTLAYMVKDSFLGAIILGLTISPYMGFAVLTLIHEVSHSLVFAYPLYDRLLGIIPRKHTNARAPPMLMSGIY